MKTWRDFIDVEGLMCDNKNCDYKDEAIPYEEYENHVNKGCPKCGENLLTQFDYDFVENAVEEAKLIAHITNMEAMTVGNPVEKEPVETECGKVYIELRGDDSVTLHTKPTEK